MFNFTNKNNLYLIIYISKLKYFKFIYIFTDMSSDDGINFDELDKIPLLSRDDFSFCFMGQPYQFIIKHVKTNIKYVRVDHEIKDINKILELIRTNSYAKCCGRFNIDNRYIREITFIYEYSNTNLKTLIDNVKQSEKINMIPEIFISKFIKNITNLLININNSAILKNYELFLNPYNIYLYSDGIKLFPSFGDDLFFVNITERYYYMSPEYLYNPYSNIKNRNNITNAIWSLGIILYEIKLLKFPFAIYKSLHEQLRTIVYDIIPEDIFSNVNITDNMKLFITQCTVKSYENRLSYESLCQYKFEYNFNQIMSMILCDEHKQICMTLLCSANRVQVKGYFKYVPVEIWNIIIAFLFPYDNLYKWYNSLIIS